jgi:hypothetical protein
MDAPVPPPKPPFAWKRLAIISLFGGAGFALMSGLILWGVVWYSSRPTPPKPWNTTAIVAKNSPGFSVSDDGKMIEFTYALENAGRSDYRIDSASDIEILGRLKDGTLSEPLPDTVRRLDLPVFVPAGQRAVISLSVAFANMPTRDSADTDAAFHERIRGYLRENADNVGGFVIFDSTNRYEIDLPKWLAEKPKE